MKKTILALAAVAALAACNRDAGNNMSGNQSAGLTVPSERPATSPTAQGRQDAMPPGLDCVRNRLSPEERRGLAAVAMEQGGREDPRLQVLFQAVAACGDELSWSPAKRQQAGLFSAAAAGAAGIREMLGGRGIRVEALDQVITGDQELMAAAAANELGNGTAGQSFAMRHSALIEQIAGDSMDAEVGTRIGNYIAFRAMAQAAAVNFGRAQ